MIIGTSQKIGQWCRNENIHQDDRKNNILFLRENIFRNFFLLDSQGASPISKFKKFYLVVNSKLIFNVLPISPDNSKLQEGQNIIFKDGFQSEKLGFPKKDVEFDVCPIAVTTSSLDLTKKDSILKFSFLGQNNRLFLSQLLVLVEIQNVPSQKNNNNKNEKIIIDATNLGENISSDLEWNAINTGQIHLTRFKGHKCTLKLFPIGDEDNSFEGGVFVNGITEIRFIQNPTSSENYKKIKFENYPYDISKFCSILAHSSSSGNLSQEISQEIVKSFIKDELKPSAKQDFTSLGIGGVDKQFSKIFRRAFASRLYPPSFVKEMGLKHCKGMILYGPPGTGKTLLASRIGKILNCPEENIKVVNGPEIFNKFIGQSEENVRMLFEKAEAEQKEKGDESSLHLIIFDEIDALCKKRGSGGGGGVGENVVNQLLTKIDGVNPLNNILLIGMTNRKDLLDDALLRPGRFELLVELELPDEAGREDIFKIHTKKLQDAGRLDDDVDLTELASLTKNYSGAEIAGVVRAAVSFALERPMNLLESLVDANSSGGENNNVKNTISAEASAHVQDVKITQNDFIRALSEIKTNFGTGELQKYKQTSSIFGQVDLYALTNDEKWKILQNQIDEIKKFILNMPKSSSKASSSSSKTRGFNSFLLTGSPGCGKSTTISNLCADLYEESLKTPHPIKVFKILCCSGNDFVGMSEGEKIDKLLGVIGDLRKMNYGTRSVLVIDDVDRLINYSCVNGSHSFSNSIYQLLVEVIRGEIFKELSVIPDEKNGNIIGYGGDLTLICSFKKCDFLFASGFYDEMFNVCVEIPNVTFPEENGENGKREFIKPFLKTFFSDDGEDVVMNKELVNQKSQEISLKKLIFLLQKIKNV